MTLQSLPCIALLAPGSLLKKMFFSSAGACQEVTVEEAVQSERELGKKSFIIAGWIETKMCDVGRGGAVEEGGGGMQR